VLGCIDDCFSKLGINNPTEEEMFQACEACGGMIREWRSQGFKMPPKAHICEDHRCDLNEACVGVGGMDDFFVEHHHQISGRATERTYNVPDIECQSMSALKFEALFSDKALKAKVIQVNNNANRKFKDVDPETEHRKKA
jgi:hypothetical protein